MGHKLAFTFVQILNFRRLLVSLEDLMGIFRGAVEEWAEAWERTNGVSSW